MGERFTCTLNTLRKMLSRVCLLAADRDGRNVGDLAIAGRDHRTRILRNGPLGIAKEPQKEEASRHGMIAHAGLRQPAEQDGGGEQGGSIQYPSRTMGTFNYRAGSASTG